MDGVNRFLLRPYWVVWQEGGRYPDVIIELLSSTTAKEDLTTKKALYERVFKTYEYFCYDPETARLVGWRLGKRGRYRMIRPNEHGWIWIEELELWLGTWKGVYRGYEAVWLRFYDAEGRVVPTPAEFAEARAQAAEAELARLKERLTELEKGQKRTKRGNG